MVTLVEGSRDSTVFHALCLFQSLWFFQEWSKLKWRIQGASLHNHWEWNSNEKLSIWYPWRKDERSGPPKRKDFAWVYRNNCLWVLLEIRGMALNCCPEDHYWLLLCWKIETERWNLSSLVHSQMPIIAKPGHAEARRCESTGLPHE